MLGKSKGLKAATAYNRAYLATPLRGFAQIPLRGTSDTLGTIGRHAAPPWDVSMRQFAPLDRRFPMSYLKIVDMIFMVRRNPRVRTAG